MPTPLDILLDPISIGVIALYIGLITLEYLNPARPLTKVKGWLIRGMLSFTLYFYLASYLPLLWDSYLAEYQIFDLSELHPVLGILIALLVFEFFIYAWHWSLHSSRWLWQSFHQLHHSAERVDTFGAFYFSPLDMIGFTFVGSLSTALFVGLAPSASTYFLYITLFLAIFQHTNINTPRWLGYIIQRPESHSLHHAKGIHAYNYSDLPIFDIFFGTFKNPETFYQESGFYHGASAQVSDMLLCRDISRSPVNEKKEKVSTV